MTFEYVLHTPEGFLKDLREVLKFSESLRATTGKIFSGIVLG